MGPTHLHRNPKQSPNPRHSTGARGGPLTGSGGSLPQIGEEGLPSGPKSIIKDDAPTQEEPPTGSKHSWPSTQGATRKSSVGSGGSLPQIGEEGLPSGPRSATKEDIPTQKEPPNTGDSEALEDPINEPAE